MSTIESVSKPLDLIGNIVELAWELASPNMDSQRDCPETARIWGELVELLPDRADLRLKHGRLLYWANGQSVAAALPEFQRAATLSRNDPTVLSAIVEFLESVEEYEASLPFIRQLCRKEPQNWELVYKRLRFQLEIGQRPVALQALRRLAQRNRNQADEIRAMLVLDGLLETQAA